ncbi:MAG: hypothetical protein GKR88_04645 [Flavobacteriaceae bacterium]|nr:MAG: hypothetical protein GKR88_04645 [Flavobacteriaceae bacterium]
MKYIFSLLISLVLLTNTINKEIEVKIIIVNNTVNEFESGILNIKETNQNIKIDELNSTILLPKKGKYKFSFTSDNFKPYIIFPYKITKRKNEIIIKLTENNNKLSNDTFKLNYVLSELNTISDIEKAIKDEKANFITFGINNSPINKKNLKINME